MITKTPKPPYYAVIFTSIRTDVEEGYDKTTSEMIKLAGDQDGFIGLESVREKVGITISYWDNLESIRKWKNIGAHKMAQDKGKKDWYATYKVRICKVERDYEF